MKLETAASKVAPGVEVPEDEIVIGKDILELLSSSMYIDPLTIYREYIQNAADSIDQLDQCGADVKRRVDVFIDSTFRSIRIRDGGAGLPGGEFVRRLTSFGASKKRGTVARGFRGVGRLAGLGYCRELVFRSRSHGGEPVKELIWDCRRLKTLLQDASYLGGLTTVVHEVVSWRDLDAGEYPEHFFEVELRGVVRLKSDRLLSLTAVNDYIAQVAPAPLHPSFSFAAAIRQQLEPHSALSELSIHVNGSDEPIFRPYRDVVPLGNGTVETMSELEFVHVPALDGEVAAVGWVLHHSYTGALNGAPTVRGLRIRVGNIQIGEANLLEELFPESRFNSWSVGEIHVVDRRVMPNGRRDNFEHNAHYANLLTHLTPPAREIARRCRVSSIERKWLREFGAHEGVAREKLEILKQGGMSEQAAARLTSETEVAAAAMARVASHANIPASARPDLQQRLSEVQSQLARMREREPSEDVLADLPAERQSFYRELIDLVYECSANRVAARALVERVLAKAGIVMAKPSEEAAL